MQTNFKTEALILILIYVTCSDPGKVLDCQPSGNMMRLAEQVVSSGEVINIAEIVEVERGCGGNLKSLLAMPIRNRHSEIIGEFYLLNTLKMFTSK